MLAHIDSFYIEMLFDSNFKILNSKKMVIVGYFFFHFNFFFEY